jgi:hypothetical protein
MDFLISNYFGQQCPFIYFKGFASFFIPTILGTFPLEFVHHASNLGIPYFAMTEDEWKTEKDQSKKL